MFSYYLIIILITFLVAATVGMVGYLIYYHLVGGIFASTRRVVARVRLKRQRDYQVDVPPYMLAGGTYGIIQNIIDRALKRDSGITVYHSWDYFITFVTDDKVIEMCVPEEVYANVSEGEQGLLVYKGNHFKHFIPGVKSVSGTESEKTRKFEDK